MKCRDEKLRQGISPLNKDGVAEMMGALILTVVIAAAVGILAVVILSGFSSAETPALRAGLSDEGGDVWMNHLGGNTLYRQTTLIMVNGVNRTSDFKTPEGDAWSTFSAGDSLASSVPYASGTEIMIIYTASENPTVIETLFCQPEIIVSPVADFTYTPSSGYSPLTVTFEDTSSGDPTSWSWDFGDGTTSPVQNPVHIYNSSNNSSSVLYEVKLTVCNGGGCSTITKYITVFGFSDFVANESVFVYGNHLSVHNGNHVTGTNSTVIITGDLDMSGGVYLYVTNIFINGSVDLSGSAALGSDTSPGVNYITGNMNLVGGPNVYGDTYVEGNVVLGDSSYIHDDLYTNGNLNFNTGDLYGETHVNGDFSITNTGTIHENVYVDGDLILTLNKVPTIYSGKNIYYTGSIDYPVGYPQSILDKCIHVSSVPQFSMPEFISMPIPSAKQDSWYYSHGYVSGSNVSILSNGIKIYSDNGYSRNWQWYDTGAENIVIVASNGDISMGGFWSNDLTGVLFAPNGRVTFTGSHFEGLVIAKNGFYIVNDGTSVVFKNVANYISDPAEYPF